MKNVIMLNKNGLFKKVYFKGKSIVSPVLITYALKNNKSNKRLGITASKKIGKAVVRNRCRRVIKEAFRLTNEHIKSGYDLVFVARHNTATAKMQVVMHSMIRHIKQFGIWI